MDITNTIKVNNERVYHAFRNALRDLDLVLPEMLTTAGVADARRAAQVQADQSAYDERQRVKWKQTKEWDAYDEAAAEAKAKIKAHRGWSACMVTMPTEPPFTRPERYSCYDQRPTDIHEHETSVFAVKEIRRKLKERMDVAGLAVAPYRVDHALAAFIASCENGEYVEKVQQQKGWVIHHTRTGRSLKY